jgi:hypothetical protein
MQQFWWNWCVQLAVAIATFLAVFAALFGDWIKAQLFRPSLKLRLINPRGEGTKMHLLAPSGETRQELARIYHVEVLNEARWPPATQVQIFLVRVEEFGPDGNPTVTWAGELPMRWRLQEINPLLRTVGASAQCDLLSAVKGKWIELLPLITPNNLVARRRERSDLVVTLQARSTEGSSPFLRIRIAWDGDWEDGELEMARHLRVSECT